MPIGVRSVVDLVLLGPLDDRRQLQESPILGDVWAEFALAPAQPQDLLISPYSSPDTKGAGPLARLLSERLDAFHERALSLRAVLDDTGGAEIAYLQGIVAARLYFDELIEIVIPMTHWWNAAGGALRIFDANARGDILKTLERCIADVLLLINDTGALDPQTRRALDHRLADTSAAERNLLLAGLLLWAAHHGARNADVRRADLETLLTQLKSPAPVIAILSDIRGRLRSQASEEIASAEIAAGDVAGASGAEVTAKGLEPKPRFYQISMNRVATPALERSVASVKGDAARQLFKVNCQDILWAVVDAGIDAGHPAFEDPDDPKRPSRIVRQLDFTRIRDIISVDNLGQNSASRARLRDRAAALKAACDLKEDEGTVAQTLQSLAEDAANERPIYWEMVEPFLVKGAARPLSSGHGTHVAGIIGASRRAMERSADFAGLPFSDGMCPDIKLLDVRVLAHTERDSEFAVIAALQYLRYINQRHTRLVVHGVNLSLSIPHNVRNFACGRTPVCEECERLVESGTVVVAAAGNRGYRRAGQRDGSDEGYAAFSITDPGNAESVITVGATHRYWPHTYGVSFFSSRGPTGDGRLKPDLVAPGERIESTLPMEAASAKWGPLDGTSMAAPHVSGAAAMLMARYSELIGAPRKIKKILCETATNLERERSFQGHGMLDVLRAFQKI